MTVRESDLTQTEAAIAGIGVNLAVLTIGTWLIARIPLKQSVIIAIIYTVLLAVITLGCLGAIAAGT